MKNRNMRTVKGMVIAMAWVLVMLSCTVLFTSCSEEESEYYNLTVSGTIYFEGEQTVTLGMSDSSEHATTFKDSITVDDITLTGLLAGKTVKSVTYVSATEVTLVVDGTVTTKASDVKDNEYGVVTVAGKALANTAKGSGYVRVDYAPQFLGGSCTYSTIAGVVHCSTTFTLPYGSFNESNINADHITIVAGEGTVTASLTEDGALKVAVEGFTPWTYEDVTYNYPVVKIDASVTSFDVDLTVSVGTAGSYDLIK
jgi:hypothetical protein